MNGVVTRASATKRLTVSEWKDEAALCTIHTSRRGNSGRWRALRLTLPPQQGEGS